MDQASLFAELATAADRDGVRQLVVGAVVHHGGKVLPLQRPEDDFMGGIFESPSGRVEAGEGPGAALVREVAEETGLAVSAVGDHLGSFDHTSGSGARSRQSPSRWTWPRPDPWCAKSTPPTPGRPAPTTRP